MAARSPSTLPASPADRHASTRSVFLSNFRRPRRTSQFDCFLRSVAGRPGGRFCAKKASRNRRAKNIQSADRFCHGTDRNMRKTCATEPAMSAFGKPAWRPTILGGDRRSELYSGVKPSSYMMMTLGFSAWVAFSIVRCRSRRRSSASAARTVAMLFISP
jgi:hypothetical protein